MAMIKHRKITHQQTMPLQMKQGYVLLHVILGYCTVAVLIWYQEIQVGFCMQFSRHQMCTVSEYWDTIYCKISAITTCKVRYVLIVKLIWSVLLLVWYYNQNSSTVKVLHVYLLRTRTRADKKSTQISALSCFFMSKIFFFLGAILAPPLGSALGGPLCHPQYRKHPPWLWICWL